MPLDEPVVKVICEPSGLTWTNRTWLLPLEFQFKMTEKVEPSLNGVPAVKLAELFSWQTG